MSICENCNYAGGWEEAGDRYNRIVICSKCGHKHQNFKIGDEAAAIRFAIDRYRIEEKGTLL